MKKVLFSIVVAGWLFFDFSAVMAMNHEVKIEDKEGIGKYLTDTEGKTLYWYKKDSSGKSSCIGPCLEKWTIYYREAVSAPMGIKAEEFGTIIREDGKKQTTFRGYPLYYCINDITAGDINRQNGDNIVGLIINPDSFPPK